jgi:hypothetical protein
MFVNLVRLSLLIQQYYSFFYFQIFQAVEHPFEESKLTDLQSLVILIR